MSGVEEVVDHPPDNLGGNPKKMETLETVDSKDEDKTSMNSSLTDSDSASLTGSTSDSWTILDKEEEEIKKESEVGSGVEKIGEEQTLKSSVEETDSESIETISDEECSSQPLTNSFHANLASFCYIPDATDSGFPSSLTSTTSTISVESDGIPIADKEEKDEIGQQYQWNQEGEKEIPEDENTDTEDLATVEQADLAATAQEDASNSEDNQAEEDDREFSLEPSEPGYDVDDDGLPGAPLAPLPQEVDLYPSQELDPSFPVIKRGEVYKHDKNLQLDHFLTAFVILALALVIGLGIGHFLGLFLSVTTSIHSSLFGLSADPFEQSIDSGLDPGMDGIGGIGGMSSFPDREMNHPDVDPLTGEIRNGRMDNLQGDEFIDDFRSINDFNVLPHEHEAFDKQLMEPTDDSEPFSIIGSIKNVFTRLGTKLGYIKKPPKSNNVVHSGVDSEEYYEFQCMTADDQPIMMNGQPVKVIDPQECNNFYSNGQTVHGSYLDPPTFFMDSARTAFKSDDQDLDDRVIRQLWDENQELREQVSQMKRNVGDNGDEAMAAILRDRINDLLVANADLEREVARLRYADAARGAAESVETLNKLRKTRDTLNDIVTENDQLKIEVAKARYGEPPALLNSKAERDVLAHENEELKRELEELRNEKESKNEKSSETMHQKFENALKYLEELAVENNVLPNKNMKQDDLNTPWPERRHEELKNDDDDDEDDDDEDIKSKSMNSMSKYLSSLVGVGRKILTKEGTIDWTQAQKFVGGLKQDLGSRFQEAGRLAKEDIGIIVNKFDELKKFVNAEKVKENMKATQTAAGKLVKSLVGAVKDLKEASEDAAEKSDWVNKFRYEANKVKTGLESKWFEIKDKWQNVVRHSQDDDEDDDDDDDDDDNDDDNDGNDDYEDDRERKYEEKKNKIRKKWSGGDDDEDEGYHSDDDDDDDDDLEMYKKKNYNDDKRYKKRGYFAKENKTEPENWMMKRAEERAKTRRGEERADWIFERAKHRTDVRYEETRGDWYFERKHGRGKGDEKHNEHRGYCDKDDDDCKNLYKKSSKQDRRGRKYVDIESEGNSKRYSETKKFENSNKQKGEKHKKSIHKKKEEKQRGERKRWDDGDFDSYHFNEEVHYSERHYDDPVARDRHERREAKRRFTKRDGEKHYAFEADIGHFHH